MAALITCKTIIWIAVDERTGDFVAHDQIISPETNAPIVVWLAAEPAPAAALLVLTAATATWV